MNSPAPSATTLRPASGARILAFRPRRGTEDEPPSNEREAAAGAPAPGMTLPGVGFHPMNLASRQTAVWRGLSGEVVRVSTEESFECEYCGPLHLLIAYQRAARHKGDSTVEGVPRSTLHDLSRKLTLVPGGIRFQERHDPSGPLHAIYLYIDPRGPLMDAEAGFAGARLLPRLFFHRHFMWETALQLGALIEAGPSEWQCYAEALGVVLAHKLLLLNSGKTLAAPVARGGLADWQRRAAVQYIEANLAQQISLAALAETARLSPLSLLPSVQKVLRNATPSLSYEPPDRLGEKVIDRAEQIGD